MGWNLTNRPDGHWDWEFFLSSHGWAGGTQPTKAEAIVELLIGEAAVMEMPYPPSAKNWMRAHPEEVAKDFDEVSGVQRPAVVTHSDGQPWPRRA